MNDMDFDTSKRHFYSNDVSVILLTQLDRNAWTFAGINPYIYMAVVSERAKYYPTGQAIEVKKTM